MRLSGQVAVALRLLVAANAHDGLSEGEEAGELVWGELERDRDHRIHPLAQQKVLEYAPLLVT